MQGWVQEGGGATLAGGSRTQLERHHWKNIQESEEKPKTALDKDVHTLHNQSCRVYAAPMFFFFSSPSRTRLRLDRLSAVLMFLAWGAG